jgi:pimeloyl-ACP methyl ester carboxylesterase
MLFSQKMISIIIREIGPKVTEKDVSQMNLTPALQQWQAGGDWLTINGQRIFVRVQGEGPPLLLLHGFPTASYDYARLVPLLDKHFGLYLLDFLGFGFSDKPRAHDYSLFEQADIVQAVCAHFGLDQITVLTHDMGNSVTLELLRRETPVVDRVIMLNGSVLLEFYQPLITQRLLLNPYTGPLITGLQLIRRGTFGRQFGSIFAEPPPAAEIDAFWSLIQYNGGTRVYHRLIRYLNERKIHEHTWLNALAQHPAPLTIIWGQRDPVSVPRIAEAVLERRPDATYFPLDAIGHYPQWEAPPRVAEIVLKNG